MQAGNLEKARDYYLKLTQMEPQNQLHTRNYEQVLARLGGAAGSRLITPEEGAVLVEELEATAPFIDQRYADDRRLWRYGPHLTDAELFVSYNMPAKALGPLMSALPKAPRDLRDQPASGGVCTPGPAASAKPRFAAAIWNSSITTPDIPTKPAATAIWPASTKNATSAKPVKAQGGHSRAGDAVCARGHCPARPRSFRRCGGDGCFRFDLRAFSFRTLLSQGGILDGTPTQRI